MVGLCFPSAPQALVLLVLLCSGASGGQQSAPSIDDVTAGSTLRVLRRQAFRATYKTDSPKASVPPVGAILTVIEVRDHEGKTRIKCQGSGLMGRGWISPRTKKGTPNVEVFESAPEIEVDAPSTSRRRARADDEGPQEPVKAQDEAADTAEAEAPPHQDAPSTSRARADDKGPQEPVKAQDEAADTAEVEASTQQDAPSSSRARAGDKGPQEPANAHDEAADTAEVDASPRSTLSDKSFNIETPYECENAVSVTTVLLVGAVMWFYGKNSHDGTIMAVAEKPRKGQPTGKAAAGKSPRNSSRSPSPSPKKKHRQPDKNIAQ